MVDKGVRFLMAHVRSFELKIFEWNMSQQPGHAWVQGNEITDKLARDGSVQKFVGPQPSFGVSRQNIR
jgi:hypothetical protein